jgi:hypothetical protein
MAGVGIGWTASHMAAACFCTAVFTFCRVVHTKQPKARRPQICPAILVLLPLLLLLPQALVYLYEVAPERRKGFISALGCVCLGLGVALGVLVVAAVAHLMPPGTSASRVPSLYWLQSSLLVVCVIMWAACAWGWAWH